MPLRKLSGNAESGCSVTRNTHMIWKSYMPSVQDQVLLHSTTLWTFTNPIKAETYNRTEAVQQHNEQTEQFEQTEVAQQAKGNNPH